MDIGRIYGMGNMRGVIQKIALAFFTLYSAGCAAAVHGSLYANGASALGANVAQQQFNSNGSQPFMNIMKTGGDWITANNASVCAGSDTNEEVLLYSSFLDANGYPITLNGGPAHTFTFVCTILNSLMPAPYFYPSGNYRVTFSGGGSGASLVFGADASATCTTSPCTISVTPSSNGIQIALKGVTSGNAITNIAIVLSTNAAAFDAGEIFDPSFKAKYAPFSTLRFMQAQDTLGNQAVNWSDRAQQGFVFWNVGDGFHPALTPKGWPYEVIFALCDKLNADCWVNEPCLSNSTYISNFAALAAATLASNLKVYPEYCNENWNYLQLSAAIYTSMISNGFALFPAAGNNNNALYLQSLQRAIDDGAIWKSAFGGSSRVVRLFGGQAGCDGCYQQALLALTAPTSGGGTWTGTAASHFDALATAPYYDADPPTAYTGDADGGLARFFCMMGATPTPCAGTLPTGAGAVTTGGTSTAYTLADGTGTGCPAAVTTNGYSTTAVFNVTNGANPTLAVDGCTAIPILYDGAPTAGGPVGTAPATSALVAGAGNPYILVYTTTTAAGSVTTSWRILCGPGQKCYGTTISDAVGFITANLADANNFGLGLILYEGGWGFVAQANAPDLSATLFNAAALDLRSYQSTNVLMNGLRGAGLNGVFVYYDGVSAGGFHGQNWGLLDSVYQTSSPKYNAAIDFIQQNPCWWSNCRH